MTAERAPIRKFLRVALLFQAAGLLAIIAMTVPDFVDGLFHPYAPCGLCLDLRGLAFALTAIFLGPVAVLLLILSWRWRGPRLWPLAIVALIDAAAIFVTADVTVGFFRSRTDSIPPFASAPLLLLLPALATVALGINLVRPVPMKWILAVSAAGSILLAVFLWFFAVRPVHQSIPGELSLPFSRTAVYEGRGLGCEDHVQGWIDAHTCTRAALLVYRGTGDPSKDEATIDQVLSAHPRVPVGMIVKPLPVDVAVSRTDNPEVDSRNAGLCLIVTDRVAAPPSNIKLGRCGLVTDYADIRSHWPGDDAYAIGIVYYWEQRDYISDHSVTFLDAPISAQPGQRATVRMHADKNTRCSIVVIDPSGVSIAGLDPKTTDAAGNVDWTWVVDPSTRPGGGPITVTCGASSGRTSWWVTVPP